MGSVGSRRVYNNEGLCGDLVSVGSVGTSYTNGIVGTNLGISCTDLPPASPSPPLPLSPPPPSPPSPPPPPPPTPPLPSPPPPAALAAAAASGANSLPRIAGGAGGVALLLAGVAFLL